MTNASPSPATIPRLLDQVYETFALLAGMQLDLFTPLKDGPLRAEQIAAATGVHADKLERFTLCSCRGRRPHRQRRSFLEYA